jgi:arylsulfatase A-like enzyme
MEKTIVIFTSDNGGVASGDNFSTSNLPLRGGKGYQWEGGLRVPYFIKVPGTNAGTCEYPVTGADFFPTILDLLDIPLIPQQHRDGISLKPILESGENPPPRALIWHYPHYGNQGGNPSSVIRSEDWKLIHYWEQGNHELYRLSSDIGEQQEVSAQYPQVTDELSRQLHRWLTENQARFPSPDPDYDSVAALERSQYLEKELWPRLEAQRLEYLSKDYQPNPDWWGSEPIQ